MAHHGQIAQLDLAREQLAKINTIARCGLNQAGGKQVPRLERSRRSRFLISEAKGKRMTLPLATTTRTLDIPSNRSTSSFELMSMIG